MKVVCHFKQERTTKGAIRYMQVEQDGAPVNPEGTVEERGLIGALYVRKFHMGGEPQSLTVTVETA